MRNQRDKTGSQIFFSRSEQTLQRDWHAVCVLSGCVGRASWLPLRLRAVARKDHSSLWSHPKPIPYIAWRRSSSWQQSKIGARGWRLVAH
jgi:hypothetical protein